MRAISMFYSARTSLSSSVLLEIPLAFHRRMVKEDNLFTVIV
jgi:hypothetical protein